ncbi:uncharacterized protein LOC121358673 [Pyrgilauda ruficollis]|uniref:uncharacterized protein LOC121358673 n=1 Tax=Pyrgilauda ruficollis TaxID=221976 RepID=UPI001B85BE0D|nr:uncharacterized protein LOC121358673 [Pyrgilauda ruficollis]
MRESFRRAVSGPQGAPLSRVKHRAVEQTRGCGRCRPTRVTNFRRNGPAAAQPAARRPSPPLSGSGSAARRGAVSSSCAGIFHVGENHNSGSRLVWAALRTVTCRARSVPPDRGFPRRGTGSTRTPAPAAAEIYPAAAGGEARLNEGKQPQACGQRGIHQGEGIKSCGGPRGSGALQGARRQRHQEGLVLQETTVFSLPPQMMILLTLSSTSLSFQYRASSQRNCQLYMRAGLALGQHIL